MSLNNGVILVSLAAVLKLTSCAPVTPATAPEVGIERVDESDRILLEELAALGYEPSEGANINRFIVSSYRSLGDKNLANHDIDKAIESYNNALAIDSTDEWSLWHLGEAYWNKHDYTMAETVHRRAVDLNPKNTISWRHLAQTYNQMNRYEESARCYRTMVDLILSEDTESISLLQDFQQSPENHLTASYYGLVGSLKRVGKIDEALEAANEGVEISDPQTTFYPFLLGLRADLLRQKGR